MNWYDWPAIVFALAFAIALSPRRRISHYAVAVIVATTCGVIAAGLTLLVWGVTR